MRSNSLRVWSSESRATVTRDSAALRVPISGMTFTVAMTSPCFTRSPALQSTSEMIPEIWGLMSTSSRGSTLPEAMTY